ncbi:hypothetical protein GCM10009565_71920 [Amycolatopsis albidoflavus]
MRGHQFGVRARGLFLDTGARVPDDQRGMRARGVREIEVGCDAEVVAGEGDVGSPVSSFGAVQSRDQLAHLSVDYVVWLEQGRTNRVSRSVLDALADALQLAPDERAYPFTVADVAPVSPRQPARPEVAPRLRQLLDTMRDIPAMVPHRRMDVLAWNRGSAALLTDFGKLPVVERNLIRLTFVDESFRSLYADWPGPSAGRRAECAGPGFPAVVGGSPGTRAACAVEGLSSSGGREA